MSKNIKIVLENGIVLEGVSFGFRKNVIADFIFNTSLVGYQEVLTDPSYHQEVVVMTFPLQGIYGINGIDYESKNSSPAAFVVQEYETNFSNNHATKSIHDYLLEREIQGVSEIDTRYLTKIIRDNGSLKGAIVDLDADEDEIIDRLRKTKLSGHVHEVTISKPEKIKGIGRKHIIFWDFGGKESIVRQITKLGFNMTKIPANSSYEEIISLNPDLIFLSNGPGDPAELTNIVEVIKKLLNTNIPLRGICLGHQLLSIAIGAKTFRLKFGHHSINHPIIDLRDEKVYITSQNHNFAVVEKTLPSNASVILKSLHDQTIEGIKYCADKLISVQFHPEASPGPSDTKWVFDEFFKVLESWENAK